MPKCTVCTHPDFQAIDQALLAGNGTLAALSRQYGPSPSALHRHKKHLQEKISQARRCLDHNLRQGYLFKLNQTLAEVEIASAKAQAADNVDQVFKGARVKNRLIRDLSKMETPWDTNTVYRLMASTQWQSQDCLLPTEPEFLAAGHKILAEALFHPCPEPTPDLDAEDDDDLDCVEHKSPALSSLSPEILATLHPDLLASLLDTFTPPPDPGTPPRRPREISAKSAPKTASRKQYKQPNQLDKPYAKNTRKNAPAGRESTRRAASAQAPPAVRPSCPLPVESRPPATGNRKSETNYAEPETPLPPGITPELLQQILRRLDEPSLTQPKTENRKLATANHPPNQREMSAKLPKKLPHFEEYNQQYQDNIGCEKNVPKNPHVGRESTRRAASAQAPPAVRPSCSLPVESRPPATGNRKPETNYAEPETPLPPGITPELLRQILWRLDEPPLTQPKTENR